MAAAALLCMAAALSTRQAPPVLDVEVAFFALDCAWLGKAAMQSVRGVVDVRVGSMQAKAKAGAAKQCPTGDSAQAVEVSYSSPLNYSQLTSRMRESRARALFPGVGQLLELTRSNSRDGKVICPLRHYSFVPSVAPPLTCAGVDSSAIQAAVEGEVPASEAQDFRALVAKGRAAEGRVLILLFGTASFNGLFVNWVVHARRNGLRDGQYALVCLDSALGPWLQKRGHPGCDYSLAGGTWEAGKRATKFMPTVRRLPLVRWLVRAGVNVLMCDLDALIWRNPINLLRELTPASDVVFSTGSWPKKAMKAWAATPCMGFALWRSRPHSSRLLWRS
eukprot:TRINITY_DN10373_c0_g1_i1.p1 TRINITY_DN10373_c0_g1~~TRINITY_DN10373_c0_g1_i1.p1  ORF type:complete len:351 (+),score=70.50 TRINITY_DN10373_c0_g1_i1:54-1055(+)